MDVSQCRQNKNGFQTSKSTIFTMGPSKMTRDIQICPLTSKLGVKYGCQTFSNLDVMHLNFFMMQVCCVHRCAKKTEEDGEKGASTIVSKPL
jgi:hypothetical protein